MHGLGMRPHQQLLDCWSINGRLAGPLVLVKQICILIERCEPLCEPLKIAYRKTEQ